MTTAFKQTDLDRQSKLPAYYQVYLTVRDWIVSGQLGHGAQLPTEAELCETFSVSRITVRKAIELLHKEELVSRERGRGTFVIHNDIQPQRVGNINTLLDSLDNMVKITEAQAVTITDTTASEDICADLEIEKDTSVKRIQVTRAVNGIPAGHYIAYMESELVSDLTVEDIASNSIFTILQDKGIDLHCADQVICAALANMEEAKALDLQAGFPLLQIQMVVYSTLQVPVVRVSYSYRSDYYQHHVRLMDIGKTSSRQSWQQSSL